MMKLLVGAFIVMKFETSIDKIVPISGVLHTLNGLVRCSVYGFLKRCETDVDIYWNTQIPVEKIRAIFIEVNNVLHIISHEMYQATYASK